MGQEGLRPMGGADPAAPAEPAGPWAEDPRSRLRDPRAEFERRRAQREAEGARRAQRGYREYLRHLVKEDQVFALLLSLMGLNTAVSVAFAASSASEGYFLYLRLISPCLNLVILVGILTFQRWAHTFLVWLAGANLALSLIGAWQLVVVAPIFARSMLQLAIAWFNFVFQVVAMLFVLVVLSERSAYFEGVSSRAEPKRTRLRDYLRRDYWREALARPETARRQEPEPPPTVGKPRMASRPSQYAGPQAAGQETPPAEDSSVSTAEKAAVDARARMRGAPAPPRKVPSQASEHTDDNALQPLGGPSAPPTPAPPPGPSAKEETDSRYTVEPLPPAPGQASTDWRGIRAALSWSQLRHLAREDGLFAALLVALAAQALLAFARLNPWAIVGAVGLLWAVLTLQRWAYWLAMALAGVQVLVHTVLALVFAGAETNDVALAMAFALAMVGLNLFIALALAVKSDLFE
jgi:hypothetical protein